MANEDPRVDAFAAADIEASIRRLLRDLGNPEPPLKLEDVRALQKLDLTYYSKSDLNLLDEIAHRVTLAGNRITTTARRMFDVVTKAGLKALIVPEQRQIYIDEEVVDKKRRFIQAHEITHDLLPWHRSLLLGDNEETLSPRCHQEMEAEANFGARQLIFLGDRFTSEVRDHALDWKTLQKLSKDYGNTITTTLWQTVHCWDAAAPTFGMIGRHPHHRDIGIRAEVDHDKATARLQGGQRRCSILHSIRQLYAAVWSRYRRRNVLGDDELCIQEPQGTDGRRAMPVH